MPGSGIVLHNLLAGDCCVQVAVTVCGARAATHQAGLPALLRFEAKRSVSHPSIAKCTGSADRT